MAQINPRSLVEARDFGDQVYELVLSNWGNRGARADQNNGSIIYPPLKAIPNPPIIPANTQFALAIPPIPSLSAIAIAPRSIVDRCIIQYAGLQQVVGTAKQLVPTPPDPSVTLLESEQMLAVGAPLVGQQPGPIIIRAVPEQYFGDVFVQDVNSPATGFSPSTLFGTALPTDPAGDGGLVFLPPELRILLYLAPPVLPPLIRAPWNYSWQSDNIGGDTPANTLVRVIPVMGRASGTVDIFNTIAAPTEVVVTITGVYKSVNAESYEVPLAGPITIPGEEGASIPLFNCGRTPLNFICIYLEANSEPGLGGANAEISVTLY